ncbi:MAG: peptidyl-prolyl cis-trans isomerase [Terriglobales bacterium]|jgi:peptidyl-prolyl cis-trans isomerase D
MIRFLQTPGPIKKIVIGAILVVICVAMLLYLIPQGGTSGSLFSAAAPGKDVVATVGSEQVTAVEVRRAARQMIEQQYPQMAAQASMLIPIVARQAAQQLIDQKALLVEAQRLGLRATDEEVRDEMQKNPQLAPTLFPGGSFIGKEKYEELLQEHQMTVEQFEQDLRDEIVSNKLRNLIGGGATVTDADIRSQFAKENTKVKFEYAVLTKDNILKELHPTEVELKAYYDRNKQLYNNSIPEKRKVSYVLLDTAKIAAETQVTLQDLQADYAQHRDEFREPEQVNLRQIVIKNPSPDADGKVDPKGTDDARKKAADVLKQLQAGGNFADLAKKDSQDPSGKDGGALGWVQRGRIPYPEVDKAAFALPKSGTSDVIDAGYAFVILHVDDKQDAHLKSLDEVKGQIEPAIKQQKAAAAADAQATALLAQARADGLDKAAAAKGLQVVTTDFVGRTDSLPGIGTSQPFMEAVFGQPEKSPPDEVPLSQGYAVFQVQAVKPAATPTFEEIHSRVETEFKNERASQLLSQKTQELSDRAKASHDLKKTAKELGATLKTSDFVLPDAQVPDVGAMSGQASVAFTLKPGEISGPLGSGTTGAVLSVLEKQEPTNQDFAAKKDQIRDSLLQNKRSELFGLFVTGVRDRMTKSGKIKINQDEMNNLSKGQGNGDEGE